MKRSAILYSLFFVISVAIYSIFIPNTICNIEGSSFFVNDFSFFKTKLANAPGLTAWLACFASQFFKWPLVGTILLSGLLTLGGVFCSLLPKALGRKGFGEWGLLLPILILWLIPLNLNIYLQVFFFFAALLLGAVIRKPVGLAIYLLIWSIIGFFLVSTLLLQISIILLVAFHLLFRRTRFALILLPAIGIVSLGITVADVYVSNEYIGYIPFKERFFYAPERISNLWIYSGMFLAAPLLMLLPSAKVSSWIRWTSASIVLALSVIVSVYSTHNLGIVTTERFYSMLKMADEKDWNGILSSISRDDIMSGKLYLRFALLAESGNGSLPDNIFNYPINTPEDFLYRHELKRNAFLFNRLFYDNLGIYDEAFRMAFEYGVMTPEGDCFSSIRQMAHYAILMGDHRLAEKYLHILSKTTLHDSWIEQERALMASKSDTISKPYIKDSFINVYPFNSEMIRQLQIHPDNRKVLDYLLIGLLMQREVQKFAIILRGFPLYKDRPLPRAYAEAAAFFVNNPQTLHADFNYPTEVDTQFENFYRQKMQNDSPAGMASYMGSYWYYYFFIAPNTQVNNTTRRQVN